MPDSLGFETIATANNLQHKAPSIILDERDKQTPPRCETFEPERRRMRTAGEGHDNVQFARIEFHCVAAHDFDLRPSLKVPACASREMLLEFYCMDAAAAADERGKYSGVISGACANLQNPVAWPQIHSIEKVRP